MKIANGEFGRQIDVSSGDEYEDLAETFNVMSGKLKQSQAMLLQAAKMSTFGQMGAGIVHEIGQPLAAISVYAELLKMGVSPEKTQHYLDTICQQTQRPRHHYFKIQIVFENFGGNLLPGQYAGHPAKNA